jgi:SAM-dependent methyltransferase
VSDIRALASLPAPAWFPPEEAIARMLAQHVPLYRWRRPRYALQLLKDLAALLPEGPCRLVDIGGGSGLLGEAIAQFFPGKQVTAIDVVERFLPGLTIAHCGFDGQSVPFADRSFDCALLCNVLHHVPRPQRGRLLAEALRVTGGASVVIKDHVAASGLDRARLAWLDCLGNLPFGGMVRAEYLSIIEWQALFEQAGCAAESFSGSPYRAGFAKLAFPNRLEILFRLRAAA